MYSKAYIRDLAVVNGVKFKVITQYASELIFLKSEGFTYRDIAEKISDATELSVSSLVVSTWFSRGSQPKDWVMCILEDMHRTRLYNCSNAV